MQLGSIGTQYRSLLVFRVACVRVSLVLKLASRTIVVWVLSGWIIHKLMRLGSFCLPSDAQTSRDSSLPRLFIMFLMMQPNRWGPGAQGLRTRPETLRTAGCMVVMFLSESNDDSPLCLFSARLALLAAKPRRCLTPFGSASCSSGWSKRVR